MRLDAIVGVRDSFKKDPRSGYSARAEWQPATDVAFMANRFEPPETGSANRFTFAGCWCTPGGVVGFRTSTSMGRSKEGAIVKSPHCPTVSPQDNR
jgi:hypothetical protein